MSRPKIRFSFSWSALVVGIAIHETAVYLCPIPGFAIILMRAGSSKKPSP